MAQPVITPDARKSFATQLKERARSPAPPPGSLFQHLRGKLARVTVDGVELFVAEGDTLLDVDQLEFYALAREEADRAAQNRNLARVGGLGTARLLQPPSQPSGLLGMVDEDGNFIRWDPGTVLTYCVLRNTFAGPDADAHYQMVVANMEAAVADWEATCNVRFQYRSDLDTSNSVRPAGVIFPVREFDTGGRFIAAAFFPNDPTDRRRVLIDPSYYPTGLRFDKVGVLRHELGHVLGFRHEHIRSEAPPDCPQESTTGTFDLTRYDPQSVMHYFCGGVGSAALAITDLDRAGAVRLYGPPGGQPTGLVVGAEAGPSATLRDPLPTAFVK